jgi:hypothetical protein
VFGCLNNVAQIHDDDRPPSSGNDDAAICAAKYKGTGPVAQGLTASRGLPRHVRISRGQLDKTRQSPFARDGTVLDSWDSVEMRLELLVTKLISRRLNPTSSHQPITPSVTRRPATSNQRQAQEERTTVKPHKKKNLLRGQVGA